MPTFINFSGVIMYELIPSKTNKKAQNIILVLFLGAAGIFFLSTFLEGLSFLWVFQLFAIILMGAAIYLVSRYTAKIYLYRVAPTDSGTDLTVHETSPGGKRVKTVCRIGLSSIKKRVKLEGKDCSLADIRKEKKPTYDYRPDLYPNESILILSDEGGTEVYICLAYDEKLFELLSPNEDGNEENED